MTICIGLLGRKFEIEYNMYWFLINRLSGAVVNVEKDAVYVRLTELFLRSLQAMPLVSPQNCFQEYIGKKNV